MRSRWLHFALLIGLVARVAFELQLAPYPRHERMLNALDDQAFFVDWAGAMARGERLDLARSPHEWAFWAAQQPHLPPQAPLYPALLALLSLLAGPGPEWIRAFQVAAGLATIAGIFLIARRRFGEAAAGLAAIGAALYAPWVFFEATVLRTSGLVLFFVAIVVALDHLPERSGEATREPRASRLAAFGIGALFGLAVLFQEQFLLLWAGSVIWLARTRREAAMWVVAGGATLVLPLILWANLASGRLVTSTASMPFNLLIANLHDAFGQVPATTPTYDALKTAAVRSPGSRVDLGAALARDFAAHPREIARLAVRKVTFLLRPLEIPDNVNFYLGRRDNRALRWLPFDYPTLLPLAIAGLVLTFRRARPAAPLAPLPTLAALYAASLVVFVPLSRLRQPLAVLVLVLAGAGAAELWRRQRPRPWLALGLVALLLIAGGALRPEPLREIRPTDWQIAGGAWENEAQAQLREGHEEAARESLIQALVHNPHALRARDVLGALDRYTANPTAPALLPREVEELCSEGSRSAQAGDLATAGRLLARATRLAPSHPRPWQLLSNALFLSADREAATRALERALALDPNDPVLAGNLAHLRGLPRN